MKADAPAPASADADKAMEAKKAKSESVKKEKNDPGSTAHMNLSKLPIRTYLDKTVVPILLQGLSALVKERCVSLE